MSQGVIRMCGCVALAVGTLLASTGARAAEQLSPARQTEVLQAALRAYDEANARARDNTSQAAALYQEAANGFTALLAGGVENAALHYNLGNTYFRLGDLGHAVLAYRRAARLAPGDARLEANLRYVRDRVEPVLAPSGEQRLAQALFFWHYNTSPGRRLGLLLALSVVGWGLLAVWLWWRRRAVLLVGLVALIIAWACGGSLYWQVREAERYPEAVVTQGGEPLRLGRGAGADLALQQPLGPGVEVRILQRRGDWVEVRLVSGQTGWLPLAVLETV